MFKQIKFQARKALCGVLIAAVLISSTPPQVAQAGNGWWVGNIVGLCAGTSIRTGPGYGWGAHTIVPENNWAVKVIGGPRYADGQTWWDTSRREAGDPSGGTGWVSQSDADRCFSNPPPATPPPATPPPATPPPSTPPPPNFTCAQPYLPAANYTLTVRNYNRFEYLHLYFQRYGEMGASTYCENYVTFTANPNERTFEFAIQNPAGGSQRAYFDSDLNLQGYGVSPTGGTEVGARAANGPNGIPGGYAYLGKRASLAWPVNGSPKILQVEANHEDRYGFEVNPPAFNYNLALVYAAATLEEVYQHYRQNQVAINTAIITMAVAAIAVAFRIPAFIPRNAAPPAHTAIEKNAPRATNPLLVEQLRQSYGKIIDSAGVRTMGAEQGRVSAKNPGLRLSKEEAALIPSAPAVFFQADGFTAGEQVLVNLEQDGDSHHDATLTADSAGKVSGSFTLTDEEVTQPGLYTLIAVGVDDLEYTYNVLATHPDTAYTIPMAGAAVNVAAAPRLVGSIAISPWPVVVGRPTTVTYLVRNDGDVDMPLKHLVFSVRGPDCPDWCEDKNADWPAAADITIPPLGTYQVSATRFLYEPGSYQSVLAYQDVEGNWRDVDGSPRFTFSVQPGITVVAPLAINPSRPSAGEVVTLPFTARNSSSVPQTLYSLFASGRGPNCDNGWECERYFDTPAIKPLYLDPGQEYTYKQSVVITGEGRYFWQPMYQYAPDNWRLMNGRLDFLVGPGLRVSNPLRLSPAQPAAGQPVTASYTIHNHGSRPITIPYLGVVARGPNCSGMAWDCPGVRDWPWVSNVRLAPGAEYTYQATNQLNEAGPGYWAEPQLGDWNPWWRLIQDGRRVDFSVDRGLEVIEPLTLTPADPAAGEMVTARAVVKNMAPHPLTISKLFVGAQGPDCLDFSCSSQDSSKWNDFPNDTQVTLQPGQTYTYQRSRMWLKAGSGYIAQLMYLYGDADWHVFGDIQRLSVGEGLEISAPLTMTPTAPKMNETYQATFTLSNRSNRVLTLPAVGVGGRLAGCNEPSCMDAANMEAFFDVTLQPGASYQYRAQRAISHPGTYFIEPALLIASTDWWYAPTNLNNGQRVYFTIQGAAGGLPECSMTINQGEWYTNLRFIQLAINAPNATRMLVSNDGGFIHASDLPYASPINWELTDIGQHVSTMVVRVRPSSGAALLCNGLLTDEIIYDPLMPGLDVLWEPSANREGEASTSKGRILIQAWDQPDGSGIEDMIVSDSYNLTAALWEPYQEIREIDASYSGFIYIRVRDKAGNLSNVMTIHIGGPEYLFLPVVRLK